jgi:hypothetical protein
MCIFEHFIEWNERRQVIVDILTREFGTGG